MTGRGGYEALQAADWLCGRRGALDGFPARYAARDLRGLLDVEGFELSACRGAEQSLRSRTIQALYFEYFEKYLIREGEPASLIAYLEGLGFVTCFCRLHDLNQFGGPTHTIADGLQGHGTELLPVEGFARPAMTDLLAIPRENLAPLVMAVA